MAIARAAETDDPGAVRPLIETLDDPDPGIRMLAIATLAQITGETMGYDATAPEGARDAAIQRWVAWEDGKGAVGRAGTQGE